MPITTRWSTQAAALAEYYAASGTAPGRWYGNGLKGLAGAIKPGDLVTIGDSSGTISSMNTRYISVAAGDGREILIPNEDLVTQRVINWTYTDKSMLVKVTFATNYEADPSLVCKLAIGIATETPNVATFKAPNCLLTEFAETGMKFSLTFWVADLDVGMDNVKSAVMQALWTAFKKENIRVPYPVRELRVRGGTLPVETILEVPTDAPGPAAKPDAG